MIFDILTGDHESGSQRNFVRCPKRPDPGFIMQSYQVFSVLFPGLLGECTLLSDAQKLGIVGEQEQRTSESGHSTRVPA